MKKIIVVLVLLSVCACFLRANEKNEKHWEEVEKRLEKAITAETQEARKAYLNYVGSLSGPELLATARFGAHRISEDEGPALTHEAAVRLSCFAEYYPEKTNNLKNIKPLLEELKTKNHSDLWRKWVLVLLTGEWRSKLGRHQQTDVIDTLNTILADRQDSKNFRAQIPTRIRSLLIDLWGKNADKKADLTEKPLDSLRQLTGETLKVFRKVLKECEGADLGNNTFSAAAGLAARDLPVPSQMFKFLDKLLASWDEQPEWMWFQLASYAFSVEGEEALALVKKMKRDADREKVRKGLKFLLEKHGKEKSKDEYKEIWGPSCQGLVMSAGIEPGVYEVGDKIEGWIAVRGTSAGKKRVVTTDVRHDCRLALYRSDGSKVRRKKRWWPEAEKNASQEMQIRHYELRGKERFYQSFVINDWFAIEAPDTYELVVMRRIKESWQDGFLISNIASFKVIEK